MPKIKLITFDLDGTLIDRKFDAVLWHREIPRLYAKRHGIGYRQAREIVETAYASLGDSDRRWYDISYWFRRFDLRVPYEKVIRDLQGHIGLYKDAKPTLAALHRRYRLVLVSNTLRAFLKLKLKTEGIGKYFDRCHSITSDFGGVKSATVFKKILRKEKAKPAETVHVGDHFDFDYLVPKRIGIRAILVDRKGRHKGRNVVRSLKSIERIIHQTSGAL